MIQHRHFILHKPFGVLTQFVNNRKRKKKLLGELYDFPQDTMAIGRLDANSEGLLFLTTDGMQSELIRSGKIEKEYYVQLDGIITEEAIESLKTGVEIGFNGKKYTTKPCQVFRLEETPAFLPPAARIRDERHGPCSWASVTLTEGKFRQVRKMTAAVGFPTLRLVRVRIGNMRLDQLKLKIGEVMEVRDFNNVFSN
ncbi:pseudouridine synthase [Leptobacterium flavescens]|uniref:Pseudouridine synthase n=1 Tax=Leptobacterium flavescens TaxID=472055 RepID=A0A6P0UFJ3_9FLAO|nr:pseudouridine synthase [Leptobacterium flavescens]NER12034.1 pseudouridine synthase [Leptobacterium flavescens]